MAVGRSCSTPADRGRQTAATPAGTPANPFGKSAAIFTGRRWPNNSTSLPKLEASSGLSATYGSGDSSAMAGAERLSSSEPKM